ncbi:flavodoxin family protein [Bacillus carboniphilus]|uniref:Flavodoxin family protein n=1 Tax=Bacillus carboniphilus TaxID=86663 RepID=A0ABP3GDH0_9BACI
MKIIVFHGSTRSDGNTEYLAHLAVPEDKATHVYLRDCFIQDIQDERHSEEGFPEIDDDMAAIVDQMLDHDVLVFATPIYWYSMTSLMKTFIDRWSQIMREDRYSHFKDRLKEKKAYVIAVGGDSPYIKGLPLIQQFKHIFEFFGTSFEGYLIGKANKPGEIKEDQRAIQAAPTLIKELTE